MPRWLLVLALTLVVAWPANATKEITLKDGRTLQGDVIDRNGIITLRAGDELYQFQPDQVTGIKDIAPAPHMEGMPSSSAAAKTGAESGAAAAAAAATGAGTALIRAKTGQPAQEAAVPASASPPPASPAPASEASAATPSAASATGAPPPASAAATPAAGAAVDVPGTNPVVTIHTTRGDIQLELFEDDLPNTVANFIKLAQTGFYEGTFFHRIIRNFMMQGGDPNTKTADESSYGRGGPPYTFDDESPRDPNQVKHRNVRGAISMANAGPNTNGSQFFILFKDAPHLDGKHTVFGHVVKGMDVVDKIESEVAPPEGEEKPTEKVIIKSVTVDRKRDHSYEPVVKSAAR